jgi:hypothetical protein
MGKSRRRLKQKRREQEEADPPHPDTPAAMMARCGFQVPDCHVATQFRYASTMITARFSPSARRRRSTQPCRKARMHETVQHLEGNGFFDDQDIRRQPSLRFDFLL